MLVGVKPDHQYAKDGRHQATGQRSGQETGDIATGVDHSGKTGQGGAQHHALGAQIDDTGTFIDQQTQRGQAQHGPGIERGRNQQRIRLQGDRVHQWAPAALATATRGLLRTTR